MKRLGSFLVALFVIFATLLSVPVRAAGQPENKEAMAQRGRVRTPLNLAVLVQDDLVARVGNELKLTREFIRSLPAGSRVMIGYITSGSLQVRQPFTNDLEEAAKALRIPAATIAVSSCAFVARNVVPTTDPSYGFSTTSSSADSTHSPAT